MDQARGFLWGLSEEDNEREEKGGKQGVREKDFIRYPTQQEKNVGQVLSDNGSYKGKDLIQNWF